MCSSDLEPLGKSKSSLKKAGVFLFKTIVRNTDKSPGDVVFSDLKVEL